MAQEAVHRATEVRPDLLVADIGLPGQDGYAVLARIREMFPEIPAVALTAYARTTDRDRILGAGFQHHVSKPVDPEQLLRLIVSLF
jgi:CheY-like chemotaxis protein